MRLGIVWQALWLGALIAYAANTERSGWTPEVLIPEGIIVVVMGGWLVWSRFAESVGDGCLALFYGLLSVGILAVLNNDVTRLTVTLLGVAYAVRWWRHHSADGSNET